VKKKPRAGRPPLTPGDPRTRVGINLSQSQRERLAELAAWLGESQNLVVGALIDAAHKREEGRRRKG